MRYLKVGLLTTLAALLFTAATTQAGQREGAFSLSPMIGYHGFEGDQNTDDGLIGGLSLGYNVNKRWAAELEVRYTNAERENVASQQDLDIASVGINALYHFNPDGPLVPYVSAGFGALLFNWGAVDNDTDDEDYMMNWGVGAKYFINDDFALRMDLRHLIDLHSDREWDHNGGDDMDHNYLATVGLYWQFGGSAAAAPRPLDSDRDGIPDVRDKCPDTPLGVLVDAVGCPPVEATPPPQPPAKFVDGDDDGDGVLNSRDKCPDTLKGMIVDKDGCPIKFTVQIEFDFDKAEVRPEFHEKLREAAAFMKKHPEAKFLLAGHTDSIGSTEYNQGLSLRRSAAVKKYLVETFGIAAHLMMPRGYGERQPIAGNDTEAGRQRNRRVEVICCVIFPEE
jgi:OOP family OmpA-OmpF porin